MIAWGGTPVGAIAGGVVAETNGVATAYLVLDIHLALAMVVLLLSPVRRLRYSDIEGRTP